jgi:hypothetical protein
MWYDLTPVAVFNGNSTVELSGSTNIVEPDGNWTLCAWVYAETHTGHEIAVAKYVGGMGWQGWALGRNLSTVSLPTWWNGTQWKSIGYVLPTHEWTLLTVNCFTNGQTDFYTNNAFANTSSDVGYPAKTTDAALTIGNGDATGGWQGQLGTIAIYPLLTDSQRLLFYQKTTPTNYVGF